MHQRVVLTSMAVLALGMPAMAQVGTERSTEQAARAEARAAAEAVQADRVSSEWAEAFAQDFAQAVPVPPAVPFPVPIQVNADAAREQALYARGVSALDEGKWQAALDAFDQVARLGGQKTDGASYWKAYAQDRLGQRTEALATLDDLLKRFPASRWLADAKALQAEVRQSAGEPVRPEQEADEDLKLMALNGLLRSDAERTIPMLQQLLQGNDSPRVKERALFVLSRSDAPQAKAALAQVARGGSNPDLQMKAVKYLGLSGSQDSLQALAEIYKSATDVDLKRQVLLGLMLAGARDRVYAVAKAETIEALRGDAVRQLGVMDAQPELEELYRMEASTELKKQILQALFMSGASDRLIQLARTEKDRDLQRTAVRNLGLMEATKTGDALVSIYKSDTEPSTRKAVVEGLFIQQNAAALVALARQEKDPELRKAIVNRLSLMQNKEATDFLLELLKKN